MPQRRRNATYKRRTKKRAGTRRKKYMRRNGPSMGPSKIIKPHLFTKLSYVDVDTPSITCNSSVGFAYNTYVVNGAYDVNSAVISTAMPGFNEWIAFYKKYRVRAVKMVTSWVAIETQPLYVMTYISGDAGSINVNWTDFREQESQNFNSTKLLTPNGSNGQCTTKVYCKLSTLVGSKLTYLTDLSYTGSITSNPAIPLYGYNVIMSPAGANFGTTFSQPVKTKITMYIEFFDRIALLN
jgi:hypothetical protein